jgi:hypothetical protein
MLEKGKFIFFIEMIGEDCCPVASEDEADGWGISINTKECWEKNHQLTDHYTEEEWDELNPVLEKLGLDEIMESVYTAEFDRYSTKQELHDALIEAGFEFNSEFHKWMMKGN